LKRIVIPTEVRDLQFAVEENHASSGTLRTNSILALEFGWRGASALRVDLPFATNGKVRLSGQLDVAKLAEGLHTHFG